MESRSQEPESRIKTSRRFPSVWAEIDLDAVSHNVRELRRITCPSSVLMAVVKANGYGHGALRIAETALKNGAGWLGVANIDEAVCLRKSRIHAPILVFGHTPAHLVSDLAAFDISQSVYGFKTAKALSEAAVSIGKTIKIHVKIDTGMGRLGIVTGNQTGLVPGRAGPPILEVQSISRLKGIQMEGLFTHFAGSDEPDKTYAGIQFERFMDFAHVLRQIGISPKLMHAANSAAVIDMPETHLDMVRSGISIYGLYPSMSVDRSKISLKPALTLKTRVIHLKKVPAGFKVSYGSTYETTCATTLATVPIGYADGYNRKLSSRGCMLVRGHRAPVVGRVCMDLVMLDVGHIPDVDMEDEVVVVGRQKKSTLSVDEMAAALDTIHYEVLTSIGGRVERRYVGGDR